MEASPRHIGPLSQQNRRRPRAAFWAWAQLHCFSPRLRSFWRPTNTFMGQDPNASDNRWLREAFENSVPGH